ncbi:hypothetical protein WJX82_005954 [Trebouxia sp. C0006]
MLATFEVDRWLQQKRPAELHVSQPYQTGCWSKLSARQGGDVQHGDNSGLHPFCSPDLPADLGLGYPEQYVKKADDAAVGVEPVAEAVIRARMQEQCDICTFRNNLNKIFGTPLELKSSWTVDACRLGSIMYLDIHQLPQTTYPDADLFQYYGYKFEALSTQQSEVDATSEYAALIRLRVDKLRILLAAEIDCFDPKKCQAGAKPDLASYLELKTYLLPANQWKANNIKKFKYPKWWLQSWLAGVPAVVAGARDKQGVLQSIEVLPTRQLPHMAANANAGFDTWQKIHFGNDVLTWMRQLTGVHKEQHLRFNKHAKKLQKLPTLFRSSYLAVKALEYL